MESFHVAFSAAGPWSKAAKECQEQLPGIEAGAGGQYLGFVYATDLFDGDLASILTFLRETTGVHHWVGTIGLGIFAAGFDVDHGEEGLPGNKAFGEDFERAAECFDQPALAIMVARFPAGSFRVFPTVDDDMERFLSDNAGWLAKVHPAVAFVHGDPRNQRTPDILQQLSTQGAPYLIGGLTSSRGRYEQVADYPMEGGLSGVLLSDDIPVVTGITQSCVPIGAPHTVTNCRDGHVIAEIDGRQAFEVFAEELGDSLYSGQKNAGAEDPSGNKVSVVVGIPVTGSDTGDYMARNLAGVDPDKGLVIISEKVSEGDPIMFCRRSREFAETDMRRMLKSMKKRLKNPPRGGVYISCVGRGMDFFGTRGAEIKAIREEMGNFPLVGFAANGEISSDRLYGYTGVLSLFL